MPKDDTDQLQLPPPWSPDITIPVRIGTIATLTCAAILWMLDESSWRIASLLGIGLLLLMSVKSLPLLPSRYKFPVALGLVICAQLITITATGGLRSPLIVILPPIGFFLGFLLGPRRKLWWIAIPYILTLIAFIVLEHRDLGHELELAILAMEPGHAHNPIERLVFGSSILLFIFIPFTVGLVMRRKFDANQKQTRTWQRHALEISEQRAQDLHRISGALAHELKNPLTAIQGLSSFMADRSEEGTDEAEQLRVVVEETRRMRTILNRLLNVARPTQELLFEPTALLGLLQDVKHLHQPLASHAKVKLSLDGDSEVICICDPRKVRQIIVNLLQNALDVAPPDSTVSLRLEQTSTAVQVFIEDEGPGLDQSIEDPFAPGITTKETGSGLGLAIARTLTAQHDGTLTLTPRENQTGCQATLTLPASPEGTP